MDIRTGYRVLDVGCGPGTDTIPLAQFVGSTGQVIGIDNDSHMIATANKNARDAGVADRVKHELFNAKSTSYDSDYFDACRSERLFQHLLKPEEVLFEMVRITKPGGWIVVADTDHSTLSIDYPDVDIEWRIRRLQTDISKNGYSGRKLYRLFKEQNISDIIVEIFPFYFTDYTMLRYFALLDEIERKAVATGIVTEEELQQWHMNLKKADERGVFFASAIMMVVAGRKS